MLCFDTLLQVLILKVVRSGTDPVPFGAWGLALAPIYNLRKSARAWNPLRQERHTPHPYKSRLLLASRELKRGRAGSTQRGRVVRPACFQSFSQCQMPGVL